MRNGGQGMNGEKYSDPTADHAVHNAMRTPDHVIKVVNMMKSIAEFAGSEVVGHIHLKDKASGREWK